MRDDHIIELLDGARLSELGAEAARVEAHAASCPPCRRAYDAARLSAALLGARAAAPAEPPPFFQTRVMAALRERAAARDDYGLGRMWRAVWSLVAAMVVVVVFLAGATLVTDGPASAAPELAAGQTLYSPEWEALGDSGPGGDEFSDEQVLAVLYESEAADADGQ